MTPQAAAERAREDETRAGEQEFGQGILAHQRGRTGAGQTARGENAAVLDRAFHARRAHAAKIRRAIWLRRAGNKGFRQSHRAAEKLSDQDSRRRGGDARGAHRRISDHQWRRQKAGHARRGNARTGLRHEGLQHFGSLRHRGQTLRFQPHRQHVGAADPFVGSDPQQSGAASVLQGHARAVRPARPGIQAPARRNQPVANFLFRPAGGAQTAAGGTHLDPQSASDSRSHRRNLAPCAPRRTNRRTCARSYGAADLRRSRHRAAR